MGDYMNNNIISQSDGLLTNRKTGLLPDINKSKSSYNLFSDKSSFLPNISQNKNLKHDISKNLQDEFSISNSHDKFSVNRASQLLSSLETEIKGDRLT